MALVLMNWGVQKSLQFMKQKEWRRESWSQLGYLNEYYGSSN